jgi:hypothetical protein
MPPKPIALMASADLLSVVWSIPHSAPRACDSESQQILTIGWMHGHGL